MDRGLKPLLDSVRDDRAWEARIAKDPLEFPHRFKDRDDIEVAALLSCGLAYGRADLFKPKIAGLLLHMGPHPGAFVRALTPKETTAWLSSFVYRFNTGGDVAVLLLGMGAALRRVGSLEALFVEGLKREGTWHRALAHFTASLRQGGEIPGQKLRTRGLSHLLPSPLGPGTAKRLNLFLRWMVRGPDGVDFGLWKSVSPSQLVMPLDTHVFRIASWLGLTTYASPSWKAAEEVTENLRTLRPEDPVAYDFALCHLGMSGACPQTPRADNCARCPLLPACRMGKKTVLKAKARGLRERLPRRPASKTSRPR